MVCSFPDCKACAECTPGDVPPPVPPSDTPPTPPSDMPNERTCKKDFCDSQCPIMGKGTVCSFPDCKACAECTPGDVPPPVPPSDTPPVPPSDTPPSNVMPPPPPPQPYGYPAPGYAP